MGEKERTIKSKLNTIRLS